MSVAALAVALLTTAGGGPLAGGTGSFGSAPALADTIPETEAFNAAKELGTIDAWQAYLNNFPNGFHADLARAYIKNLGGAASAPAPVDEPGMTAGYAEFPIEAGSWGGIVRSGPAKGYPQQDSLGEGEDVSLLAVAPGLDGGYPWFKIGYGPKGAKGYMWGGILCSKTGPRPDLFQTCGTNLAAPNPPQAPASGGGFTLAVNAPGWCHGALNGSERIICSDFRLSKLDAQLTSEFQMAVSNITSAAVGGTKADVAQFRNEQAAWIRQRNSCGSDLPCIQSIYQGRLKALAVMNQPE